MSAFAGKGIPSLLRRKLGTPSPHLHTTLPFVDLLQQDLTGKVVPLKVSERTFELFEIKFLVLELPLPEVRIAQQYVQMKHAYDAHVASQQHQHAQLHLGAAASNALQAEPELISLPPQHNLPQQGIAFIPPPPSAAPPLIHEHPIFKGATQDYFIVPDFETLLKIHNPTNVYRLYPRKSTKVSTYATMREICSMPHSPFTMSNREDTLAYRFVVKSDMADVARGWTESLDGRMLNFPVTAGMPIALDGIFVTASDVGFVLSNQALTEKTVSSILGMIGFCRYLFVEGHAKHLTSGINEHLAAIWNDLLSKRKKIHFFVSGDRPPARDALGFAKSKGVHMFTRFGPYYKYIQ